MKTVPRNQWPDWIRERLEGRKNIEVKENCGRFYLYEYKNVWDKNKKKPKKITRYAGTLKKETEYAPILDHGNVCLLYNVIESKIEHLKKAFPEYWKHLLVFSMSRAINPMPIKRIPSWFERTSLSKLLQLERTSSKTIRKALEEIGKKLDAQNEFMKTFINENEFLLYDGSVIYSSAKYNRLLEAGYNKEHSLLPKANVALLFSKTRNTPVYFKVFFGSVHEINTIPQIMKEISGKEIFFVADKGYYKDDLYDKLHENKIKFAMPLPRDDRRIEYNRYLNGVMEYKKRMIRYTSYVVKGNSNYRIYQYEDQLLKYEETTEYLKLKKAKRKVSFKKKWAGKIAILSNVNMDPEELYLTWKSRDEIEKAFHILQNVLETDTPHVSNEDVFRGYMFASFISLYMFYKVMNIIREKNLLRKLSVEDVLFELSKVMLSGESYKPLEMPKRTRKIVKALGLENIITKIGSS